MFGWFLKLFESKPDIHETCQRLKKKYVGLCRILDFNPIPDWDAIEVVIDGVEFEDVDNRFWRTLFTDPIFHPWFILDCRFTRFSPAGLLCCEEDLRELVRLINRSRESAGVKLLEEDYRLTLTAFAQANWMVQNEKLIHRQEMSVLDRIMDHGYESGVCCGELIAAGFSTTREVFDAWMNDRESRKNILYSNFDRIGLGYSRWKAKIPFWCLIFASRATFRGLGVDPTTLGERSLIFNPMGIIAVEEFTGQHNLYNQLKESK